MHRLIAEKLTKEAFAPFGSVIEAVGSPSFLINEGTTTRFHALAEADVETGGGKAIISIFRGQNRGMPFKVKMMERHPLASQAFMPLANHKWLVVVSEATRPSADNLRLFLAGGNQGVQYGKGVWHHPLLILEDEQDFLVIDRKGGGENLEEVWFKDDCAVIDTASFNI